MVTDECSDYHRLFRRGEEYDRRRAGPQGPGSHRCRRRPFASADPLMPPAMWWKKQAAPDFAWLARHSWAWNPARLDELIRAAAPATLYVCGGAANELELADRFTRVFLLEIDEPTMLARIDARQDNDWGRIGDTREYLRRFLPGISGPPARIRRDPHRRQAAPRRSGERDPLPHVG